MTRLKRITKINAVLAAVVCTPSYRSNQTFCTRSTTYVGQSVLNKHEKGEHLRLVKDQTCVCYLIMGI